MRPAQQHHRRLTSTVNLTLVALTVKADHGPIKSILFFKIIIIIISSGIAAYFAAKMENSAG